MSINTLAQTVLVTGASGFVAMHCIAQLLEKDYLVRGTIRTPEKEYHLRQILKPFLKDKSQLEFVIADLLEDKGWHHATHGCDYVLHTASPFPFGPPDNENDLIVPAKEGTLRVLEASSFNGVKRVVLTSSMVAIIRGHDNYDRLFDESDWSNLDGDIGAYPKSKTLAEKAAWDFVNVRESSSRIELSVINPGLVLGPILNDKFVGTSAKIIRHILAGNDTSTFRNSLSIVDVRDVAIAHIEAMNNPIAAGNRYCCLSEVMTWEKVIRILDAQFKDRGYKIDTNSQLERQSETDILYEISNEKIKQELGWKPRSAEEAIIAMGESLIDLGIV